jgi:membrane-bound lytic murein transglycosylase A
VKKITSVLIAALMLSGCGGSKNDSAVTPNPFGAPKCTPALEIKKFANDQADKNSQDNETLVEEDLLRPKKAYKTPTRLLGPNELPAFSDDLDFDNMTLAIDRQLRRFNQLDLSRRTIEFGGRVFSGTVLRDSLKEFKNIVSAYATCKVKARDKSTCVDNLNATIREKFNVYVPDLLPGDTRYGEKLPVLFTGYYTPTLEASVVPTADKPHSIYKKPSTSLAAATRAEIDFKNVLRGKGLELFYTKNLFDLYLLHVQGGGKAIVTDKKGKQKSYYLTYDGTNGQKWTFISKYMIEKGYINSGSIEAQRHFLDSFPAKEEEIFATCPSYVYFKVTAEPPHGSDMVPLTDNRSIATDTNHYLFKGALAFVEAKRPADPYDPSESCNPGEFKNFSRFYLDQDTGGAIKGKGRVDLYFGESQYSQLAAYNTVQRGNLYFLLLK